MTVNEESYLRLILKPYTDDVENVIKFASTLPDGAYTAKEIVKRYKEAIK